MGLLERSNRKKPSRVILRVLKSTQKAELQSHIRQYVLKDSEILTDKWVGYNGLNDEYTHNVIDHAVSYAKGHVHTNGLENFWALLKRFDQGHSCPCRALSSVPLSGRSSLPF